MQYTIDSLRQKLYEHVYDVYEIFQNFFGEEYTDLQDVISNETLQCFLPAELSTVTTSRTTFELSDAQYNSIHSDVTTFCRSTCPYILVWWPKVTVTNENDRSIEIQDLFAKIELTLDGAIPVEKHGFLLNRSTYSAKQFVNGYLHSHIPHFSYSHYNFRAFERPCLGRGPIIGTINTLKMNYDETTWMLFCQELALYVTVESLAGIPYYKLESVGNPIKDITYVYTSNTKYDLNEFVSRERKSSFWAMLQLFSMYYLENGHLSFSYVDGKYEMGMDYYDFIIDISNSFIEWFNSEIANEEYGAEVKNDLFASNVLKLVQVSDRKFYNAGTIDMSTANVYIGRPVLTFKGKEIKLNIIQPSQDNDSMSVLLNNKVALTILQNILNVVNYYYKYEHTNQSGSDSRTSETASSAPQAVFCI